MRELWFAFWIFLPAGVANMSPVFVSRLPLLKKWDTPLDFGKKWRGKRLLGNNKTWRGVVFGSLIGTITAVIEFTLLVGKLNWLSFIIIAWGGLLLGTGALVGDALESFIKRRVGVKAGQSWFPFDQCDFIIGGLAFSYPLVRWPLSIALTIFSLYFGLHLLVSYIGHLLGLKERAI